MQKQEALLQVDNLIKHFSITRGLILSKQVGAVHAVDNISFAVKHGETLGLVGESGCGKSTTARVVLRLIEPTSGTIMFNGIDIRSLDDNKLRAMRKDMQIIFQDPYGSLNPRMTVGDIIGEPLEMHHIATGKKKIQKVYELLEAVGLKPVHAKRYPHEFSGGQRQRIGIARALTLEPKLIICDEAVSALDVSIQAQILNLLQDLQEQFDLTFLFIAHDLSVVKHISDNVAVMYLGKIVEMVRKEELYSNPQHPYTEALLSAIPLVNPLEEKKRILLQGSVPSPINPPSGCRFHTRCPAVMDICSKEEPEMIDLGGGHYCACHLRKGGKKESSASQ